MTIRMGPHLNTTARDHEAVAYIGAVGPNMVKFLNTGLAPLVIQRAHDSGAITVFRQHDSAQNPDEYDRFLADIVRQMQRDRRLLAAEGYNETLQGKEDMALHARLDIRLMEAMESIGRKAVIGSFSTGQPQLGDGSWREYLPALERAAANGHYVGLHEYSAPTMQWGVGENQWNGGRWLYRDPANESDLLGYWTLRYRRSVAEWKGLGLRKIPKILITEAGIDDIQPRPGPAGLGWLDYYGRNWEYGSPGDTHFGDYASQWAWYCGQLSADDYVAGACDFGWGTYGHGDPGFSRWQSFDLSGDPHMLRRMTEEMKGIRKSPPPPPPPAEGDYRSYTVQRGDTLWGLGGTRWRDIYRAVPMGNPRDLEVGAKVFVPKDVWEKRHG